MLLSILSELSGAILAVVIVAIIIGSAVGLLEVFASTANFIVLFKNRRMRRVDITNGQTVSSAVRIFLDSNGMSDVKIEQAGFWRGIVFGNHYNIKKNVFFVRKRQMNSARLSYVTDSVQRAAKAMNYREGDKKTKKIIRFQNYIAFMPYFVIPLILVGVVLDALLFHFQNYAMLTLIFLILGLAFFIFSAVLMFMTIKVEKAANDRALEIMINSNFLTDEEITKVKSIFKWRIISYIANFILALIRIVQYILRIIGWILKGLGKAKK